MQGSGKDTALHDLPRQGGQAKRIAFDVVREFAEPAVDLTGLSVLVTGGTGSFGRAFVAEVLKYHAVRKLIVFSRDEQKQYEMAQHFDPRRHPCLRYFIGDVRDPDRLELAMRDVDVVVHAAALKHVPIAEYNPFECIRTNVHGAENVVKAALRTNVRRVIALSTDKAANPINLYGASKLAADKILVAANNLRGHDGPVFAVVRYGNVIGSRGSVVPMFRRMIAEGRTTLPITDPGMTRFWITLRQSVRFVLSSIALMQGGEIFVPKIPSMRIGDLARALAPHLEHEIIGARPGEKMHEVLIGADDARNTIELDDRFVLRPLFTAWDEAPYQRRGARPVGPAFRYASNENPEWLTEAGLTQLLAKGL